MKRRALIILLVMALVLTLPGCGKVDKVEEAIDAIGTVTLDDANTIAYAEELYYALSASEQGKVENSAALIAARKEFDRLTAAVQYCIDCINAIGEVTMDSGDAIKAAREAWEALRADDVADYAAHMYPTLTTAEFNYDELCAQVLYIGAKDLYDRAQVSKLVEDYRAAWQAMDTIVLAFPEVPTASLARVAALDCILVLADDNYKKEAYEAAYDELMHCQMFYGTNERYDQLHEYLFSRLSQIRPANGKIFRSRSDNGLVRFRVIAEDTDICLKLQETVNPESYLLFYVRAGEEFTVHMSEGEYILKYTFGPYWFGEKDMFGDEATYMQINGTADADVVYTPHVIIYDMYTETISKNRTDRVTVITADEF